MEGRVESLIERGIASAKADRKEQARALFAKAVKLQPENEDAWMWLSKCLEDPEEKLYCLQRVVNINPHNVHARTALSLLKAAPAAGSMKAERRNQAEAVVFDQVRTAIEGKQAPVERPSAVPSSGRRAWLFVVLALLSALALIALLIYRFAFGVL